ncbi:hypothetical protein [Bradyrhizobium sp. OAE829]|uniref:hypothetical protein n=1 Tax=Bradyrhizobium sp. OAE829 TaxID=2663807 RepID=UPI00178A372C
MARTSSGPNSLDASAINIPAQMAKIAVILRVIILKIPCHWGETISASQQSGKYAGIRVAHVICSTNGSARIGTVHAVGTTFPVGDFGHPNGICVILLRH